MKETRKKSTKKEQKIKRAILCLHTLIHKTNEQKSPMKIKIRTKVKIHTKTRFSHFSQNTVQKTDKRELRENAVADTNSETKQKKKE